MKKIGIFTASDGKNLELSQKIQEALTAKGVDAHIVDIAALDLPLFSNTNDKKFSAAELVAPVKTQLEVNGFFFVAPEYNGSTPPTFNNFLAWVSRSTKDWRQSFNSRPAAIATYSAGGGIHALMSMRMQLSYIGMNVIGRQLVTTAQKPLDEASLTAICNELIMNLK